MPTFLVTETKTWRLDAPTSKEAVQIAGKLRDHPDTDEFSVRTIVEVD